MDNRDYDLIVMGNGKLGWTHEMIVTMNRELKEEGGFVRLDAEELRSDGRYERIRFYFSNSEQAEAFVLVTEEIAPGASITRRPR